jgi:fatty acid amide hydrolase 2
VLPADSARPPTERSALALAAAIRNRELSARDVVEAHIELLERVAPRLNAIAMDRFEDARREAEVADRRVATSGEDDDLPPLLGVPFTVKESIAVRGMPSSAGLIARRAYRSAASAPVVERLLNAGAIPLGVTNTSELTLWIESYNPLYGRTSNAYDPTRTAGGSSGGEGAAVGSGGSPFGLASDIAGSIRIPAQFNGVFGHKPSTGAVPNTGMYPPSDGAAGRMLGVGPLARRAEDLMPVLRLIAGPDGADPFARARSFGDPAQVSIEGLSVVTVEDSALTEMSREMRDARERAVGALLTAGARLRRVKLRSWRRGLLPYLTTLQAGSTGSTSELIVAAGDEPPTWRTLVGRRVPYTLAVRIALAAGMLPESTGSARHDRLLDDGRRIAEELIDAIGDGVLLHPAHPRVAPRHGRTVGRLWLLTPAAVFNLAGVPVTEVPLGLSDGGLPLGVQVAAGLECDHVSIAVALHLERALGGWVPPRG